MIFVSKKLLKQLSESRGIISWLIWRGLFLYRMFRYFLASLIQFYYVVRYRKDDIIKAVFVAPIHSSHFQYFLSKFEASFPQNKHLCIMLINSDPTSLVASVSWRHLLVDKPMYRVFGYSVPEHWLDDLWGLAEHNLNPLGKTILYKAINRFTPQLIWIHDLQSAGYLVNDQLSELRDKGSKFLVCCSVWGNDLYFFHEHPLHRQKLTHLLEKVDFLHGECPRDGVLAKNIGFDGILLPTCSPTLGGKVDSDACDLAPGVDRELFLVVKSDYPYRTNLLTFIDQIDSNPCYWANKAICFMPLSPGLAFAVEKLKFRHGLNIEILKSCNIENFQNILSNSKFFLTCNLSDGSPMSIVAATNAGCVSIFSNHTGICDLVREKKLFNLIFDFNNVEFTSVFEKLVGNEHIYLGHLRELIQHSVINEVRYDEVLSTVNRALLTQVELQKRLI